MWASLELGAKLLREPLIPVTCGTLEGTLHMSCFLCPGIHSPCIEYEGQMITPKKFTILGEKQNLKDWKKAVRVYKSSMRDLMERGFLEFSDHDQTCTGKCMSRAPSRVNTDPAYSNDFKFTYLTTPAAKKSSALQLASMAPGSNSPIYQTNSVADLTALDQHVVSAEEQLAKQKDLMPTRLFKNTPQKKVMYVVGNSAEETVKVKSEPVSPAPSPQPDVQSEQTPMCNNSFYELVELADRQDTAEKPVTDAMADSLKFWTGIVALGLMDDCMKEIKLSLDLVKYKLMRLSEGSMTEAVKLSNVVKDLGLFKVLQEKMVTFHQQTQQQQVKLNQEITVLEKKWVETQKRKSSLAKRQQLIEQVAVSSRLKRPLSEVTGHDNPDEKGGKSKSLRLEDTSRSSPLTTKSTDGSFIITLNSDAMETAEKQPTGHLGGNEDFLVTITSGRDQTPEDKIFSERQKELEMDHGADVSPDVNADGSTVLTPRRSGRTRTPSAKWRGLDMSDLQTVDNEDSDTEQLIPQTHKADVEENGHSTNSAAMTGNNAETIPSEETNVNMETVNSKDSEETKTVSIVADSDMCSDEKTPLNGNSEIAMKDETSSDTIIEDKQE